MSDVASQSRGGLKENCTHSKPTGPTHLEGSANGDLQASEPPSSNTTPPPPPLTANSSIAGNKKGTVTAKKKALDPTEVRATTGYGEWYCLMGEERADRETCALPAFAATV